MTGLYRRRNSDELFRVISRFDGVTICRVGTDGKDIDKPWTVSEDHFNGLYRPNHSISLTAMERRQP